jgi:hypothetical protein
VQPCSGPDGPGQVQLGPDQQRAVEAAQQGHNLLLTGEGLQRSQAAVMRQARRWGLNAFVDLV